MKMKCYYDLDEYGKLWGGYCSIVDAERYDKYYSLYLMNTINAATKEGAEKTIETIRQVENGEIESFDDAIEIFEFLITKDKVHFEYFWESDDWKDWDCELEEFKRALVGWRKFLEMPRDINSYLEVKLNDIEK